MSIAWAVAIDARLFSLFHSKLQKTTTHACLPACPPRSPGRAARPAGPAERWASRGAGATSPPAARQTRRLPFESTLGLGAGRRSSRRPQCRCRRRWWPRALRRWARPAWCCVLGSLTRPRTERGEGVIRLRSPWSSSSPPQSSHRTTPFALVLLSLSLSFLLSPTRPLPDGARGRRLEALCVFLFLSPSRNRQNEREAGGEREKNKRRRKK